MEISPLLFSICFLSVSFLFQLIFYFLNSARRSNGKASTPLKTYPLVGNLPQLIQNRHRILDWLVQVLDEAPGHTVTVRIPGFGCRVFTADPTNLEYMLRDNFDNYPIGEAIIGLTEDLFGRSIFHSEGEEWQRQRKAAGFEFNTKSLKSFIAGSIRDQMVERLVPLLRKAAQTKEVLDMQDILERLGFDNICRVAFGEDPRSLTADGTIDKDGENMRFYSALDDAQIISVNRAFAPVQLIWKAKRLLNIGSERKLKESVAVVRNYAAKIVRSRMSEKLLDHNADLLSRFATNKEHTEELLVDTVINFMVAGRDTTSAAVSWFFWRLSSLPHVENKILEELRSIRKRRSCSNPGDHQEDDAFRYDELREMHYVHAAISESLRLHPPVPADSRTCRDDDVMPDGTFVRKGWPVTVSSYALGRIKDVWGDDCMEFKPERWLDDEGKFRPESPFKFLAFHAGPRLCLGKEMAYIQMKSVVAAVLEKFEVHVMGDKAASPETLFSIALKMKHGLPIRVTERQII